MEQAQTFAELVQAHHDYNNRYCRAPCGVDPNSEMCQACVRDSFQRFLDRAPNVMSQSNYFRLLATVSAHCNAHDDTRTGSLLR